MLCKIALLGMRLFMVCIVCYVVRVSHYVTQYAHHSQAHSQERNLTQHDMLPQHPVNLLAPELFFLILAHPVYKM